MKEFTDKHRSDRSFEIDDWVLLKLQPHKQLRMHKQHKFSPKFYGPFQVVAKCGAVAYKLRLPENSIIHDVFHISKVKNAAVVYWLVQWSNGSQDDATWEIATHIQDKYPKFDVNSTLSLMQILEDKEKE
ncbi:retrotransposon-related protein [Tanacetum coccineum]